MTNIPYDELASFMDWTKTKSDLKFNPQSKSFPIIPNCIYWAFNDGKQYHVDLEKQNSTVLVEQMRVIDIARIDKPRRTSIFPKALSFTRCFCLSFQKQKGLKLINPFKYHYYFICILKLFPKDSATFTRKSKLGL